MKKTPVIVDCPIDTTINVLKGKCKAGIILKIHDGANHFGSLKKNMTISDKLLALQLNDLAEDGIITKTSMRDNPLLTKYQLTGDGLRLYNIIGLLEQWGIGYKQFISSKTGLVHPKPHSV